MEKHKPAMQEKKILAEEREVLSRAVGHKGLPEEAQLMNRVIESARRDFASKQELYEKESVRLKKNVTRREKMIDKLQERLKVSVLVDLIDKCVDAVLLDEDEFDTYVVLAVQYDERKGRKYYEAT